jgi:antirestriction protein ArdC
MKSSGDLFPSEVSGGVMRQTVTEQLQSLAERILTQMREGADNWFMPWHNGLDEPFNLVTGKVFKGHNAAILWDQATLRGYQRNQWATLRQWNARRAKVRRGAKGVRVFAPRFNQSADMFDGVSAEFAGFRSYFVFNIDEVNNFNPDHPDMFAGAGANPRIDEFVLRTEAKITYGGDHARCWFKEDCIEMPPRHRFRDTRHTTADEGFYSTIVHELIHWTKNVSRANRPNFQGDAREAYAFEELVAELGAAIICTRFDQRVEPREDHAAYLKGWLSVLENNFDHFYQALKLAQIAVHWLYRKTDMAPEGWSQDYQLGLDDEGVDEGELESVTV